MADRRTLTVAEKDAQGFALLEQLASREGLHHYRELLAALLPTLKAQGEALVKAAEPTPVQAEKAPAS